MPDDLDDELDDFDYDDRCPDCGAAAGEECYQDCVSWDDEDED